MSSIYQCLKCNEKIVVEYDRIDDIITCKKCNSIHIIDSLHKLSLEIPSQAKFLTRFEARVIDFFIALILAYPIFLVLKNELGINPQVGNELANSLLLLNLTIFPFLFLYEVIMLTYFNGATFGKKLCKIKVVNKKYQNIGLFTSALRFIMYRVSTIPLYYGLLNALWDDESQGWHDLIAETIVIYNIKEK